MIKKSPYEILELKGNFEFKDIKKAYRKAIRENPPEQNPEQFLLISDAYDILTNEEYFIRNAHETQTVLEVSMNMTEEIEIDNSRYLRDIFEVPFTI